MTAYVLDTSVISMLVPNRSVDIGDFADWIRKNEERLFIPTIVVIEIMAGIEKLQRCGGHTRASRIGAWLQQLLDVYGDRVLHLDTATAACAGRMSDAAAAIGRHPGLADVLIAATARVIGADVLTRNVRHFAPLGIVAVDPFAAPFTAGSS